MKNIEELKECPFCHSNEGYYEKISYSGKGVFVYDFKTHEEKEDSNTEMYDCLNHKYFKSYYCLNCNKRIAKKEE